MPNKNYLRGRRLEWRVKKSLEADGFHVMRTAGSHGAFDLIAVTQFGDRPWVKLIQCKVVNKLTDAKLNALMKELRETSPISADAVANSNFLTEVELVIKEQGKGSYKTYPLES